MHVVCVSPVPGEPGRRCALRFVALWRADMCNIRRACLILPLRACRVVSCCVHSIVSRSRPVICSVPPAPHPHPPISLPPHLRPMTQLSSYRLGVRPCSVNALHTMREARRVPTQSVTLASARVYEGKPAKCAQATRRILHKFNQMNAHIVVTFPTSCTE